MSYYSNVKLNEDYSWPESIPEPPYPIHPSMIEKFDPAYVKLYEEHFLNDPTIAYSSRYPLRVNRGLEDVIGESEALAMAKIFDIEIPRKYTEAQSPIPARVFIPKGEQPGYNGWPVTVWFHGGGWVLGDINTENSFCTHIAELSRCVVISVEYRLAPENPFPACLEDGFESLLYVFEHGEKEDSELGVDIDITKICVAGSSAGGNITASVTQKFASYSFSLSQKFPPVCFQMLVVPVTDNTASPQSEKSWDENYYTAQLTPEKMIWFRKLYLPNGYEDEVKPEASPLFFPDESFARLPPCFIACAECDILRSEAEAYARKLIKNGVPTKIMIYQGVAHTMMVLDKYLEKSKQLIKDSTDAIKEAFYR
ncbi:hypothetical protein PACTADRAFT_42406 [Pachysolen tannophilus NRRL Y-2460]|uniref:Alpha/beta hydrolase fold-3 domain-containing protein n=1 Tax=Pachysolen tannophilus NRRL Y-2460 TaxID=669874 RepID=A0A1E4TUK8_PACTA|nr:hypothetical protein PACTADRAFT_42406 [Pachysolen tannophilus NRRL Y-2460]